MIQELIDKNDTAELVRDQLAALLALEIANQKTLAVQAAKNPALWDLRVFAERSNPWELADDDDPRPIVNVWWESAKAIGWASDTVERQTYAGVFNLDVYGFGVSQADGTGHVPGDEDAALQGQRAARLVRNIVMAGQYTYLGLRGLVASRMVEAITSFQPQQDAHNVAQVVALRLSLRVEYLEFSPQYVGQPLELLNARVYRAERDGEILVEATYEYPLST